MKIALCQIKASNNIESNFIGIMNYIDIALKHSVDVLLFPECALTGYPPIEISSLNKIDFIQLEKFLDEIKRKVIEFNITLLLGNIKHFNNKYENCVEIIQNNNSTFYSKRALWGWDKNNFSEGTNNGIFNISNIKCGIRICYEIRFPEYFRELFKEKVDIAFISFCDISENLNMKRYELIKSHLLTRAVENTIAIISVNSVSKFQTAPSCIIDPDGEIIFEAPINEEGIFIVDYNISEMNFGREGKFLESIKLTTAST